MQKEESPKLTLLNIIVFVLSIYVLLALLIDTFTDLSSEVSQILQITDFVICIFFFFEFWFNLYKAENKLSFMKWGWIDLLSSIPMIDAFRFGRGLRLIRLIRLIRAYKSSKQLVDHIFKNKAEGAFASVSILAILLVIFSSIAMLQFETDPESNIRTAEDALWWSYTTVTTVGYGDKYPVTTEGRIVAAILMTAGVGLFGTFTAFVASYFTRRK